MRSKLLLLVVSRAPVDPVRTRPKANSPQAVETMAKEVRHEIIMLPYYGVFDDIKFSVNGYDVTLMGQVTDPTLKHDAENVVKHGGGSRKRLITLIEVLPASSMDDGLRLRLYRAIYGFPARREVRHARYQTDSDYRQKREHHAGGCSG